jgi:hypothetical protein
MLTINHTETGADLKGGTLGAGAPGEKKIQAKKKKKTGIDPG